MSHTGSSTRKSDIKRAASSGSSSSKSSTTGFLRKVKENAVEMFVNMNSTKPMWGQSWILFLLEFLSLLQLVILGTKDFFSWDSRVNSSWKYAFMSLDPMIIEDYSLAGYTIFFTIVCCFVSVNFAVVAYLFYTKTSNEFLNTYCVWMFRIIRTILFFPISHILLSPLRCRFTDGSFTHHMFPNERLYVFPFLLFAFLGILLSIIMLLFGCFDTLFMLDKFKGISYWTSSPDGRMTTLIYLLQVVTVVFGVVGDDQGVNEVVASFNGVLAFISFFFVLIIIRFIPWFHFQHNFVIITFLYGNFVVRSTSFTAHLSESYFSLFVLVLAVGLLFVWLILIVRYILLIVYFGKGLQSNFFLCYFSLDVVIGIYVRQKFDEFTNLRNWCGKKNRVYNIDSSTGRNTTKFIRIIQSLLDDENFEKTKTLCCHLITLVLEDNPLLSKAVMNHTLTIISESFLDIELSLEFYRLSIANAGESGGNMQKSRKKRSRAKMMTELQLARRREENLSRLIRMLLQELDTDDRKVSYSSFPQILSTIQGNQEYCEEIYERLVKVYPCPTTYRRYASYLITFLGDRRTAKMFLKEANQLEFNQTASDESAFDNFRPSQIMGRPGPSLHVMKPSSTRDGPGWTEEGSRRSESDSDSDGNRSGEDSIIIDEHTHESTTGDESDSDIESRERYLIKDDKKTSESTRLDNLDPVSFKNINSEEEEGVDNETLTVTTTTHPHEEEIVEIEEKDDLTRSSCEDESTENQQQQIQAEDNTSVASSEQEDNDNHSESANMTQPSSCLSLTRVAESKTNLTNMDTLSEKFTTARGGGKSVLSLGGNDQSHLSRKVSRAKYFSVYLIRCFCISLLLYVICGIVSLFVMSFVLEVRFHHSANLISTCSQTQKKVTEIAHFIRKLQISYYDEDEVPFDFERRPEVFRQIAIDRCDQMMDQTRWLYENMNEKQREPFHKIHLYMDDHITRYDDNIKKNEYRSELFTLYDAVSIYGDRCYGVLNLPESRFGHNHNTSSHEDIHTRIENDENFFYIQRNEINIHDGIVHLIDELIETERENSNVLRIVYIIVPSVMVLFYILNCLSCLLFTYQQQRGFRGLLLIPKNELHLLMDRFGFVDDSAEEDKLKKENEISSNSDEQKSRNNNSGGYNRAETVRCSLIQQFWLYNNVFITICTILFICYLVTGSLTIDQFNSRNIEYEQTLLLESKVHRIHFLVMEYLYRNDSLWEDTRIIHDLEEDWHDLISSFEALRFGNEKIGTKGNDHESMSYDIYYRKNCDFMDTTKTQFERLECRSLQQKLDYMIAFSERLVLQSDYLNLTELRQSEEYKMIIMLDNFSNGSVFDHGAIDDDMADLDHYIEGKVNGHLDFLDNFSLLVLIIFLPAFCLGYFTLFRKFPERLRRYMNGVKNTMMLMSNDTLVMNQNIYEFVSGRSSNLNRLFKREMKNRLDVMFDVIEMSNSGFVCFDGKNTIIHFNNTADELFRIKANGSYQLEDILTSESIKTIEVWKKRKLMTSYNGELTARYEDQEYPVLADICRSSQQKNVFIGIFENMESSKKKDLLKESERKSEKLELLMRNILPAEIAETAKIEDFKFGRCVVYQHKRATAYFADICNFTGMSRKTNPETIIMMLHKFYCNMDVLCEHHGLEKIKTIGDCYFCVSGIPTYKPLHAVTAMEFSIDVLKMLQEFNRTENPLKEEFELQVRTGLSSGKLVAGIIGRTKRCYDIWGPMINEAARMESNGIPGKIQVSRSCYASIFDKFEFMERSVHLQGVGMDVKCYVHTPDLEDPNNEIQKILEKADGELNTNNNKKKKENEEVQVFGDDHESSDDDDGNDNDNDQNEEEEEEGEEEEEEEIVMEQNEEVSVVSMNSRENEVVINEEPKKEKDVMTHREEVISITVPPKKEEEGEISYLQPLSEYDGSEDASEEDEEEEPREEEEKEEEQTEEKNKEENNGEIVIENKNFVQVDVMNDLENVENVESVENVVPNVGNVEKKEEDIEHIEGEE